MAKTKTRYRYIRSARRRYSRRKGLFAGKLGTIMLGAAAGFGSRYIPQILGKWTNPAVFIGAGYILNKSSLMSIGAYELGRSFATNGTVSNGNGSSNYWEG